MVVKLCSVLCLLSAAARAAPPATAREAAERQRSAVAAAMAGSLAKQRAAVEVQLQAVRQTLFQPTPPTATAGASQCDPLPKAQVDPLIEEAGKREGVKTDLLRAVIEQESGYRPCAVSPKGAMGLMQLMPATAARFGARDPFQPAENIDIGAKFLKELLTRYGGDVSRALAAYNAGPATVDNSGGVPAISETLEYVNSILGKLPSP